MARRTKIGLALSGGGLRGAVHIGVIKVLEKAGIPIDALSGSSAGALVAASYACGSLSELEMYLKKVARKDIRNFIDNRSKQSGLFAPKKVESFLRQFTKGKRFSDLNKELFVMASDLETGKGVLLNKGDIAKAVLASCTVPPFFKPLRHKGRLLADGGLLHHVPVKVLKTRCSITVASWTMVESKLLSYLDANGIFVECVRRLRTKSKSLKGRIADIERFMHQSKPPTTQKEKEALTNAVLECLSLGVANPEQEAKIADVLIKIPLAPSETSWLSPRKCYRLVAKGEKAAEAKTAEIIALIEERRHSRG